ncbi:hypothetical protein pneo_cds_5 [Pandoravirus neocaledonia]|uniref:Uncharacterized protein n=1 Tax=Pandoravirus neocaledonia TaxID=2107708 RepID=A0A2U7UB33_9VIRU|nr:hypothetical protein pneo_cds_5 [Pandoravirus neocaledonia]AVK75612.1 hypothetical protein pneo_cds_5 [Pandoravirus neocaledonia]
MTTHPRPLGATSRTHFLSTPPTAPVARVLWPHKQPKTTTIKDNNNQRQQQRNRPPTKARPRRQRPSHPQPHAHTATTDPIREIKKHKVSRKFFS